MRKVKILAAGFLVLLLSGAGIALAHPDVIFSVYNDNDAEVYNSSESYAYTGYNETSADQDVEGSTIDTGNAKSESTIENDINQSVTGATVTDGSDVNIDVINDNYAYVTLNTINKLQKMTLFLVNR